MKLAALLSLAIASCGCVGIQETYAPPEQRKPFRVEDGTPLKAFVKMNEPGAAIYFVRDIGADLQGGTWRWTQQRPTLMFNVPKVEGQKFKADFTIAGVTFEHTGPVTIAISINDHLLDKTTYKAPGDQHFEKAVTASWLHSARENIVVMEIDKLWVAPADKATFGFILTSAGFLP